MCGIAGKVMFDSSCPANAQLMRSMLGTMAHRGPDDEGIHVDGPAVLGHRRLSIIGVGNGHQPLCNENRTVWITFNGEIYNYQTLKSELLSKGHHFYTDSDTEVIVHLYEEYGPDCATKLRGMFAFAIWDSRERSLFVARDRLGIKPLYYYCAASGIVFASEMKALLADVSVQRSLDLGMVDRYLTFFYLPGEETLFHGIRKLEPAHYLLVKDGRVQKKRYWDLAYGGSTLSLKDAEVRLGEIIDESVRIHMISEVPVGILLSGGLDSTAILATAAKVSGEPLQTFTIGFEGPDIVDERPYARLAARRFGTEHHETTITWEAFRDFLPKFLYHMEEPVCEPPAVALFYVSKFARQRVKVLLSGEGGDEAFGGYPNYRNLHWLSRIKRAVGPLNGMAGMAVEMAARITGQRRIDKYGSFLRRPLEECYYSRTSGPYSYFNREKVRLYSEALLNATDRKRSLQPVADLFARRNGSIKGVVNTLLYVDTMSWLPDDLLVKADKITMANSLELRVPLLDHQLVEFAASLPDSYKVRGNTTKFIAKRVLKKRVPGEIVKRKKAGFPVPYNSWMRNELRGWVRDVLFDRASFCRTCFVKSSLEELVTHNEISGEYSKEVFSLVALELWHRAFAAGHPLSYC